MRYAHHLLKKTTHIHEKTKIIKSKMTKHIDIICLEEVHTSM